MHLSEHNCIVFLLLLLYDGLCNDSESILQLQVRASAPDYASSGGFVKIEESEISGVTNLKVEFVDLDVKAAVYHVHQVPLDASSPGDNICVTTGGHFNPYGNVIILLIQALCLSFDDSYALSTY